MAIESAGAESEMEEMSSETMQESETVEDGIDLDPELLGGNEVSPGDIVRITVVSGVDPETGMWKGKYASDKPKTSAIDEMAKTYKSPREMSTM